MRAAITFSNAAKLGPYEEALREAGIEPLRNPDSLDSLHGLLLTGGPDINPARYKQEFSGSEEVNDERDAREDRLLREALDHDIPVLAICRGLQMFNVVHGGTLIQHLPNTDEHRKKPRDAEPGMHPAAHSVHVAENTRLAGIIGAGKHEVNSRHHQAADPQGLGKGLVVSAVSPDGVIEGLELSEQSFAIAVQWHPEDRVRVSEADRKLFEAFAAAVALYSGGRTSRNTADQPGHPRLSA